MAEIRIDIASEFKDKGFKKADKATTNLNKSFKTLSRNLAAAFSVAAVTRFAQVTTRAFMDKQKETAQLTSALESLNQAFRLTEVDQLIDKLESTYKIGGEQLVPAFSQLARVTGDVDKAQKLLNISLDIAAGTGKDLGSVTAALSRAMTGNTTALGRLNVGLDKNILKYNDVDEILSILEGKFEGSAARAVNTFEGQVRTLTIASDRAREAIGEGLVDAINILGGQEGITGAANEMQRLADETANVLRGLADMSKTLGVTAGKGFGLTDIVGMVPVAGAYLAPALQKIIERGQRLQLEKNLAAAPVLDVEAEIKAARNRAKIQAALDKGNKRAKEEEAKRLKKIADMQKKSAAAQMKADRERAKREKEAQQLKRAGTVFDMEAIQIVAALQNRVTEENRLRLTALLAIYSDNAEAADKLTQAVLMLQKPALENLGITLKTGDNATDVIEKIIKAQTKLFLLNTGITTIPKAKNPFEDWDSILDRLLSKINSIKSAISGFGSGNGAGGGGGAGGAGGGGNGGGGGGSGIGVNANPADPAGVNVILPNGKIVNPFETFNVGGANIIAGSGMIQSGQAGDSAAATAERQRIADIFETIGTFGAGGFNPANVTVNVAGNVMSNDDLLQVITEGLYQVQKRGQSITLSAVGL